MKLSIVSTLYCSETYIVEFCKQICETIPHDFTEFEIILVDDGSPDNSLNVALELKKEIPQIIVIELSRNFGHHYAVQAGLSYSKGDLVFLIDCDLEVSPLYLKDFYSKLKKEKCDVVYGVQNVRKGKLLKKYMGGFFWTMFNLLSQVKIPNDVTTERLMNADYVKALVKLGDKNLFLGGMMYWVGFNQIPLHINKENRKGTTYSFRKRLNLLVDAITSFSEYPLKKIFQLGMLITLFSFLIALSMVIKKLINPEIILMGYTSIMIAIFISLGIITSCMGLIGIYLAKVFKQVQNRPNYLIKKIH